jgi:hypothetical protein
MPGVAVGIVAAGLWVATLVVVVSHAMRMVGRSGEQWRADVVRMRWGARDQRPKPETR